MSRSKKYIYKILGTVEEYFDHVKYRLSDRLLKDGQIQIVSYRSYGKKSFFRAMGRVLEDKMLVTKVEDGKLRNFLNTYKRFGADPIPSVDVKVDLNGNKFDLQSGVEGYFSLGIKLDKKVKGKSPWFTYSITSEAKTEDGKPIKIKGEMLVPPKNAEFGVISDLDDTLIKTDVTSLTKMLYNTLFKNAHSRLPFKGVPSLYWALRKGKSYSAYNPLFYVSNSPWNLYDMLIDFMDIHKIPKGPILLRDFGWARGDEVIRYKGHKYNEVVRILKTYPKLKFILMGDSGEKDADTYREVVRAYPGRILAIYIRSVNDKKRSERILKLADKEDDVEIVLVQDSLEAAKHALENGFISTRAYQAVEQSMFTNNDSLLDLFLEEEEE